MKAKLNITNIVDYKTVPLSDIKQIEFVLGKNLMTIHLNESTNINGTNTNKLIFNVNYGEFMLLLDEFNEYKGIK